MAKHPERAGIIPTTIRHGQLTIDVLKEGIIRIARHDKPQVIEFSMPEWAYLQLIADLHGFPMITPDEVRDILRRAAHEDAKETGTNT